MSSVPETIERVGSASELLTTPALATEGSGISRRQLALGVLGSLTLGVINRLPWRRITLDAELGIADLVPSWETIDVPEHASEMERLNIELYNNLAAFSTPEGLMKDTPGGLHYAAVWPFGRVLDALSAGSKVPGQLGSVCRSNYEVLKGQLSEYWSQEQQAYLPVPVALATRVEVYNDDNLWIGLILVRDYLQTGNHESLAKAKIIYKGVVSQWIQTHGGFPWERAVGGPSGPVAVSNAPAIILGQLLFTITNSDFYHQSNYGVHNEDPDVVEIYQWVTNELLDDRDGLLYDGMGWDDVSLLPQKYTYEQGVGAAAAVMLGDTVTAQRMIAATLDKFDYMHSQLEPRQALNAPAEESDNSFNAIFFEYALQVTEALPPEHLLRQRVRIALWKTAERLQTSYPTLLEHAGALHLVSLARLYPPFSVAALASR